MKSVFGPILSLSGTTIGSLADGVSRTFTAGVLGVGGGPWYNTSMPIDDTDSLGRVCILKGDNKMLLALFRNLGMSLKKYPSNWYKMQ